MPERDTSRTCVIYVRISQADIRSLRLSKRKGLTDAEKTEALTGKVREHIADCRGFAEDNGLAVAETFAELGSAGPNRGRGKSRRLPERERLMRWLAARDGPVTILTTEVARLYRDVREGFGLIAEAERLPGLVVLDTGGREFDLSDDDGRCNFIDACNLAERESRTGGRRRRNKELRRAKSGGYAGHEPFGYRKVYEDDEKTIYTGRLVIVEAEAAPLRDAARRVIDEAAARPGVSPSMAKIAAEWTEAKVGGRKWDGEYLARMLRNPLYAGWRVHRAGSPNGRASSRDPGKRYPGQWEAILTQADHDDVVRILTDPGRRTNSDTKLKYALSGLGVCQLCGTAMRVAPHPNGRAKALRCPPKPYGCGRICQMMEPIEDYVVAVVTELLELGGEWDASLAAAREQGGQEPARERVKAIDGERAGIAVKLAGLDSLLAAASLEDQAAVFQRVTSASRELTDRRAALNAEREQLTRQITRAAPPAGDLDRVPDWDHWPAVRQREWLRRYVDAVIIHPMRPGARFDPGTVQVVPGSWWRGWRKPAAA